MSTLKNIESTLYEEELIHLRRQASEKENQVSLVQNKLLKKGNEFQQLQEVLNETLAKFRLEANRAMELESELQRCNESLRSERFARNNMEVSLRTAKEKCNSEEQSKRHMELELENYASRTSTQHQQDMKRLQLEKQHLESRLRAAEIQLQEEKSARSSKSNNPTNIVNTGDTFESQIKDLQSKLSLTQQELIETSNSLTVARKEAEKASRLQNELITAHNAKMQAEALLKREKAELQSVREELQDQAEELHYWRSTFGDKSREDDDSGAKLQELNKELEESRARELALKKKLDTMEARETELVMEKEEALEELYVLKESSPRPSPNSSSDIQELCAQLEEKDVALSKSREYANELQHIYKETLKACDIAEARVEELEKELQSLTPLPPPLIVVSPPQSKKVRRKSFLAQPTPEEMTPHDEASILRLLTAVDRLRSERDSLRRAVHFTSVEHRMSLETAQEQLAAKDREMTKLHIELETLRQQLDGATIEGTTEVLKFKDEIDIWRKRCETLESERANDFYVKEADLHTMRSRLEEVEGAYHRTRHALEKSSRLGVVTSILIQHLNYSLEKSEKVHVERIQGKEEALAACSLERANLHVQLLDATKELETRGDYISTLHSEVQDLKIQNSNLQCEVNESKEELMVIKAPQISKDIAEEQDSDLLRLHIATLEQRVMRRTEQIGTLQHDSKRLETNLRVAEETIVELSSDLEDVKRNCECLVDDCAQARKERDSALHRVENLEVELETTLQADLTQKTMLEGSLIQAETEIANQSRTIEGLVGAAFDSMAKLRSVNSLYAKVSSQFGALKVQMSALEGQYAHSLAENERLTSRIESMEMALVEQTDEIDRCKQDLLSAQAEVECLSKIREELGHQKTLLESQLSQKDQEQIIALKNLQVKLTESREMLATNKQELESIRKDSEESYQSLQSLREKDGSSNAEITRLNSVIHELQAEHSSTLNSLRQDSDEDRLRLQAELEATRTAISDLREEHVTKTQALEEELVVAKTLRQTAEVAKGQHETELERVRSECAEQILVLQSRIEEETAVKVSFEAKLRGASDRVIELEDHLAAAVTRHELNVQGLNSTVSEARLQLDEQIEANHSLQCEKTAWESQRVQLETELERAVTRYEYAERQYKKSEHELQVLELDIQQLRDQGIQLEEALQAAKTELISRPTHLEQNPAGDNNQREEEMDELREKIDYLEEVLQMKSAEIEENDDRFIEVLKDKKRLQGKMDSLERKNRALQTKFDNLTAKNEELSHGNEDLLAKLKELGCTSDRSRKKTDESTAVSHGIFHQNNSHRLNIPRSKTPTPPSSGPSIRPPTRIPSSPAAVLRAKTPEPSQQHIVSDAVPDVPLVPSFAAQQIRSTIVPSRTLSHLQSTNTPPSIIHSGSDAPLSSGRKRRLPDDFDSPARIPVQAMVASLENSTPRLSTPPRQSRRTAGNDSKGFTPRRMNPSHQPQVHIGSSPLPRRSVIPLGEATNSPRGVHQPLQLSKPSITSNVPSAGVTKAATKSWLSKSRMLLGKDGRSVTMNGTGQRS